jgi:hypothetical protein
MNLKLTHPIKDRGSGSRAVELASHLPFPPEIKIESVGKTESRLHSRNEPLTESRIATIQPQIGPRWYQFSKRHSDRREEN